jgi:rod shape-determining protein MreC
MENLITRHRNVSILVAVLFAQVLGLAVQVKRSSQSEETRLIRLWTVSAVTPFEKVLVWTQQSVSGTWHNYLYLRGVRAENRDLKQQIEKMRIEQVRLSEDAEQARRLQLLLGFKEKFIAKTVAAQVIGSSGSEQSRSVYIDKGSGDGVKTDQAVMTAEGIVGKVIDVYQDHTAKVLLVNDQSSGVGVVLEKSRLQGILRGTPSGELVVEKILSDESVQPGERVLTSGGDQIFPKGLDVGVVSKATPGSDSFLNIRLKPAANLSKLEEVLVVTQVENRVPPLAENGGRIRAADILADRLPSVPPKPAIDPNKLLGVTATGTAGTAAATANRTPGAVAVSKPIAPKTGSLPSSTSEPGATAAVSKVPTIPKIPANATGNGTTGNPPGPAISSAAKRATGASPSAASAVPNVAKTGSTAVVPTATGNAKPSLVTKPATATKPATDTGAPVSKPASKSAVPVPPPAAPPEDNPQ